MFFTYIIICILVKRGSNYLNIVGSSPRLVFNKANEFSLFLLLTFSHFESYI